MRIPVILGAFVVVAGTLSSWAQVRSPAATPTPSATDKVVGAGVDLKKQGAPGTVAPATPGVGVAPGISAPVMTPTPDADKPGGNAESVKAK